MNKPSTRLDKRQRGEPFHRVAWRRLRQKRVEQRLGDAADDGTGFERAPRDGIGDGLDIGARQRLDDLVQAGLFDRVALRQAPRRTPGQVFAPDDGADERMIVRARVRVRAVLWGEPG